MRRLDRQRGSARSQWLAFVAVGAVSAGAALWLNRPPSAHDASALHAVNAASSAQPALALSKDPGGRHVDGRRIARFARRFVATASANRWPRPPRAHACGPRFLRLFPDDAKRNLRRDARCLGASPDRRATRRHTGSRRSGDRLAALQRLSRGARPVATNPRQPKARAAQSWTSTRCNSRSISATR